MKLKAKIIIVVSVLVVMILVSVAAVFLLSGGDEIEITFPKDYVVITEDNISDNSEYIELLGYTEESFGNFLKNKNIKCFASDKSNSMQFSLSSYETELSEQIGTLSSREDENLKKLIEELKLSEFQGSIIETEDGDKFYELVYGATEDAPYISLQYVTVKNENYYILNYYGSESKLSDEEYKTIRETLNSLKIKEDKDFLTSLREAGTTSIFYIVFSSAAIIAGFVVIVLLIISIVRDIRINRRRDDSDSNFKIRRKRRYK